MLTACGADVSLDGSISASYPLDFDQLLLRKQETYLLIEYLKAAVDGQEKICKVIVDTNGVALGKGSELKGLEFASHVWVQRVALKGGDFPAIDHGELQLDEIHFTADGKARGSFSVVFDGGRDLHGHFAGALVEVAP